MDRKKNYSAFAIQELTTASSTKWWHFLYFSASRTYSFLATSAFASDSSSRRHNNNANSWKLRYTAQINNSLNGCAKVFCESKYLQNHYNRKKKMRSCLNSGLSIPHCYLFHATRVPRNPKWTNMSVKNEFHNTSFF